MDNREKKRRNSEETDRNPAHSEESKALRHENDALKQKNQALEQENQQLREIIQALRDIERHLSGERMPTSVLPTALNALNTQTYQQVFWNQVAANLQKQAQLLTPQLQESALLLTPNAYYQVQSAKDAKHEALP